MKSAHTYYLEMLSHAARMAGAVPGSLYYRRLKKRLDRASDKFIVASVKSSLSAAARKKEWFL